MTFKKSALSELNRFNRVGWQQCLYGMFLYVNDRISCNFNAHKVIADFGYFADNAAHGCHFITRFQRFYHGFLLFRLLHLRANKHEVKQDENKYDR